MILSLQRITMQYVFDEIAFNRPNRTDISTSLSANGQIIITLFVLKVADRNLKKGS